MRIILIIIILAVIALTCGPKTTETAGTVENSIRFKGRVVYSDTINKGAPDVWVVCGTIKTDSTPLARRDSAMTDLSGQFIMRDMPTGALFYELYREPRRDCVGGAGEFTLYDSDSGQTWIYAHRPDCPNAWGDTIDSTYK